MDCPRFRRQRMIGAVAVLLLAASSLALAAGAGLGQEPGIDALRMVVAVIAVAAGRYAGRYGGWYLLWGRHKGSPLAFAPPRWLLGLVSIFTALFGAYIVFALWTSGTVLFSAALWPVMLAM